MHRLSNAASSSAVRRSAAKAAKPVLKRGAHKDIKFSNEGRAAILTGVDVLANAVSVTLGPKGACFAPKLARATTDTSQVATSSSSSPSAVPKSPRVSPSPHFCVLQFFLAGGDCGFRWRTSAFGRTWASLPAPIALCRAHHHIRRLLHLVIILTVVCRWCHRCQVDYVEGQV